MSTLAKDKTEYHHGDLREALLKVARETLEMSGANGLSLRELARKAGVSHSAPYRHFASRQDLLVALATAGFNELSQCLKEKEGKSLKAMGQAYVAFAIANPALYKLMFSPELDRKQPPLLSEAASEAFDRLQKKTEAITQDTTLTLAAWAMVHGLSGMLIDRLVADELLEPDQLPGLVESVLGHLGVSVK
ncbi:MAG: TetR family transcriptional regulator [Pusillimonas sp.]|nr:TetR family transcriptional regulator [Pusillimonas sp.]MBC42629.1 TetR family transcriptional regulator [Pusillimonas sp.]HCP78891.1 TetR family transcriptional regulator [Pusillimonas sp.]